MAESKITQLYRELCRQAEHSGGIVVSRDLFRGARIAVRLRGGFWTVGFSRRGTELGAAELETFRRHCHVPDGAERLPAEGQLLVTDGTITRYHVGYRWPATAVLPGFEDTSETARTV